jgi:integrase
MARRKRQYGTGFLKKTRRGWVIRWRETEIAPDGTQRKVLRYETLDEVTRKQASDTLAQRVAAGDNGRKPTRSLVAFRTLAAEWQAHVLPMYKPSTQKNHRHILQKHLLPQFGDKALAEVTRHEVQAYVAQLVRKGYAPKTTDHIHDVLSAVLRIAIKWGHLIDNPARDVDLPELTNVRPKWALTIPQATALLEALPPLPRTMVGLALLSGLRRGELFALRWRDFDEQNQCLTVREAVYEGAFSTPKTTAGLREIPLSNGAVKLMVEWRARVKRPEPESLVFSTWSGKPISPNNVSRRWIYPACETLDLKRVN